MKIKLTQLRLLVKEEVQRTIAEGVNYDHAYEELTARLSYKIMKDRSFGAAIKRGDVDAAVIAAASVLRGVGETRAADYVEENLAGVEAAIDFTRKAAAYDIVDLLAEEDFLNPPAGSRSAKSEEYVVEVELPLPPQMSGGSASVAKKNSAERARIAKKHGVEIKMTGASTANPTYKVKPAFATEAEAQALADKLHADVAEAVETGRIDFEGVKPRLVDGTYAGPIKVSPGYWD